MRYRSRFSPQIWERWIFIISMVLFSLQPVFTIFTTIMIIIGPEKILTDSLLHFTYIVFMVYRLWTLSTHEMHSDCNENSALFVHNAYTLKETLSKWMGKNVCQRCVCKNWLSCRMQKRHSQSKAHTNKIVDIMQQIMAFELLICRQFQVIIIRLFQCAFSTGRFDVKYDFFPRVHIIVFCTFDVCDSLFLFVLFFCEYATHATAPLYGEQFWW